MIKHFMQRAIRFATILIVAAATLVVVLPTGPAAAGTTNRVQKIQWLTHYPRMGMPSSCAVWDPMYLAAGNYEWNMTIKGYDFFDYWVGASRGIWLGAGNYRVTVCLYPQDDQYFMQSVLDPYNPNWGSVAEGITIGRPPFEGLPVDSYYLFGTALTPLDW